MSNIQVVLLKDFPPIGGCGEVVQVKLGYARNFLLPQKIAALLGSPEAKKIILEIKARHQEKMAQKKIKQQKKVEKELKQKQTKIRKEKLLAKSKK